MFSGGLDSLIAWYYLGKPKVVHVSLGHRYAASELVTVTSLAKQLDMDLVIDKRLSLGDYEAPDAYIPMRNLFLAMIGALYGDRVYMVFQYGEQSIPDRSPAFLEKATEMLSFLNGRKIIVDSTFLTMTKADMIKWYLNEYKGDPSILSRTFSCYSDHLMMPCGACAACFRRWVAFELNCLPTKFLNDITTWPGIKGYVDRIKAGKYDLIRAAEIETVLRRHGLWK
jgi:7-cyano-7-deazaguanine synthase in queuosine biosynthesis